MSDASSPSHTRDGVEDIARGLRQDIWSGRLKGGQPLRQDELAARFHVSKIPLREALAQLKSEGLVSFYPNRGAVVSELTPAEVDELYTMRMALECSALERAIPNLTIAALQQAAGILDQLDSEQDAVQWSELNWHFHAVLYGPAGMPRMMQTIKTLHFNISRYLIIYLKEMDFQDASQAEHRAILSTCREGDLSGAVRLLQWHLSSANEHLLSFLEERDRP